MKKTRSSIFICMIMLFGFLSNAKAEEAKYDKTLHLINVIESEMDKHYNYLLDKKLFEDALGRIIFLFDCIKSKAPELLEKTDLHKNNLIMLLSDTSVNENQYTNIDIIYILYNLRLYDYIDVLDVVYQKMKSGAIDPALFDVFIFQDFNVSNQIAKNYKDQKVQNVLNRIIDDVKTKNSLKIKNSADFILNLERLKGGLEWEDFGKQAQKLQPPVLHNNYQN